MSSGCIPDSYPAVRREFASLSGYPVRYTFFQPRAFSIQVTRADESIVSQPQNLLTITIAITRSGSSVGASMSEIYTHREASNSHTLSFFGFQQSTEQ